MNSGRAIDASFAAFGVAATYVPAGGGSPVSCRIILDKTEDLAPIAGARGVLRRTKIEARVSQIVTRPTRGATFTVGTTVYTATGDAYQEDPDNLVWTLIADR